MQSFIGKQIKHFRKTQGFSQESFAKSLLISSSALSRIENGEIGSTDSTLFVLMTKFNVSEEWLLNGIEPMIKKPDDDQYLPIFSNQASYASLNDTNSIIGYYKCSISTESTELFLPGRVFVIKIISNPPSFAEIGAYVGIDKMYESAELKGHYLFTYQDIISFIEMPFIAPLHDIKIIGKKIWQTAIES